MFSSTNFLAAAFPSPSIIINGGINKLSFLSITHVSAFDFSRLIGAILYPREYISRTIVYVSFIALSRSVRSFSILLR
jgi:hypothetical protein